MKKFFSALILLATFIPSFAIFNGNGYYRIENESSHRYATMQDNRGSINTHTSSADVAAVQLYLGFENVFSDPASVMYLEKVGGSGKTSSLDIQAQGVSMYQMISHYLTLYDNGDGTYYAYGSASGMTLYLCDPEKSTRPMSYLGTQSQGYRKWLINPIDNTPQAGFGVKSEVTVAGENYAPFYAGFPFSTYSSNMEVYYINKVDSKYGIAVMAKATGVIPAATPVFIKCNSADPASNLLNIGGTPSASISNNQLRGIYFDNSSTNHYNRTPYDKQTMRIFGVTSEGKLGFITEDREFLPRNRAYLTVPAGSAAQYKIMSQAEYDQFIASIPVDPESIDITNTDERVQIGKSFTLNLVVKPSNAKVDGLTWTSSDNNVAKVDNKGVVTGVGIGECYITATLGQFTDRCKILVYGDKPTIVIDPQEITLNKGEAAQISAKLYADKDYQLTWSSSDETVATVQGGKVTALKKGTAIITVSYADAKATCKVVVNDPNWRPDPESIDITNTDERVQIGKSLTLNLVVNPSDAKVDGLTWTSSDNNVAKVDNNGVVTGVGIGECYITATLGQFTDRCKILVYGDKPTIVIDPQEITLNKGEATQISAKLYADKDYQLAWSSSDETVATVQGGKVTALKKGTALITVSYAEAKATCKVVVNDPNWKPDPESIDIVNTDERVQIGKSLTLNLVVNPSDAKVDGLTWSSSDNNVAKVDNNGVVTGVGIGECYITATLGQFTDRCKILVYGDKPTIVIDPQEITLNKGEAAQISAKLYADKDYQLTWSSSDETVATVQDGTITALKMGTAFITVSYADAKATCRVVVNDPTWRPNVESIDITNTDERVQIGKNLALSLVVTPTEADIEGLTWSTSDTNVAKVDNNGVVTGIGIGECYIIASFGQFTDSCKVLVYGDTPVIIIENEELTLTEGDIVNLGAKLYADDDYELTWSSSDETVATVQGGTITALKMGTAFITVSYADVEATCKVVVNDITGISEILSDHDGPFDVYSINGVCLMRNVRSIEGLQKGLYIINGVKVLIK